MNTLARLFILLSFVFATPFVAVAQSGDPPPAPVQEGEKLSDGHITFEGDDGVDFTGVVTSSGEQIEVTLPGGTTRWYWWDAEEKVYKKTVFLGADKTLKFWTCPSCGTVNYERSDGADGIVTRS